MLPLLVGGVDAPVHPVPHCFLLRVRLLRKLTKEVFPEDRATRPANQIGFHVGTAAARARCLRPYASLAHVI